MNTERTIDGKIYRVRESERLISITGPMEQKKPHRAVWSKNYSEWLSHDGLAGFEGHSGPRVTAFKQAANAILDSLV